MVFGIDDDDAATVRRLGYAWTRRVHILLHDTQEERQIDKEIPVFGGLSVAVCSNYHIVFVHLLHRAATTPKTEQAHNRNLNEVGGIATGTRARRFTFDSHDADDIHLLSTLLPSIECGEYF